MSQFDRVMSVYSQKIAKKPFKNLPGAIWSNGPMEQ